MLAPEKTAVQPAAGDESEKKPQRSRAAAWLVFPWFELLLTLFFLWYVSYRVFKVPLYGDEWGVLYTIRHFSYYDMIVIPEVRPEYHHGSVILGTIKWSAPEWNAMGHFFNLLLSRAALQIGRLNELQSIRIPNLLGFVIYLIAAWRIRRHFKLRWVAAVTFLALVANDFVLDYFGLSRGYGLAVAFTLLSLSGLLDLVDRGECPNGSNLRAYITIWSAFFAILSCIGFLQFYFAMVMILVLLWLRCHLIGRTLAFVQLGRRFISNNLYLISNACILGAFLLPRAMMMKRYQVLNMPSGKGFLAATLIPLLQATLYDTPLKDSFARILAWSVIVLTFGLAGAAAVRVLRPSTRREAWPAGFVISLCLLPVPLMMVAASHFIGGAYPYARAVLYLVPLFVLQVACFADSVRSHWIRIPLCSVLLAYGAVGLYNLNLTHAYHSEAEIDVPKVLQELAAIHARDGKPVVLCTSDGIKWNVWYYAEKMMKVPEADRLVDFGCSGQFDWLTVYEVYCGRAHDGKRFFVPQTTHLFLAPEDMPIDWVPRSYGLDGGMVLEGDPHEPTLLQSYPFSHWLLYSRH